MNGNERAKLAAIMSSIGELLRESTLSPVVMPELTVGQLVHAAKAKIRARRQRQDLFPGIQVADPAWDLLLELYIFGAEGRRVSVTGLGLGANVPGATVLRWLAMFQEAGLIVREPDPLDRRRIWVKLTESGLERVGQAITISLVSVQPASPTMLSA